MIESKVKWSTVGGVAVGLVMAGLNALQDSPGVLDPLPPWAQWLILVLAPALTVFLSGYSAHHTERPDLAPPPAPTSHRYP